MMNGGEKVVDEDEDEDEEDEEGRLVVLGSSWVMMAFMVRTFSNALEGVVLCALMMVGNGTQSMMNAVWMGVLIAFGCWVRITFPLFAWPIALYFAFKKGKGKEEKVEKEEVRGVWDVVARAVTLGVVALMACGVSMMILAAGDSVYYGQMKVWFGGSNVKTDASNSLLNFDARDLMTHLLYAVQQIVL
eukprot:TRINITY_DN1580_c0_g2_i1.p1 TRINITY_DN1580_c0_g2~~TRINITY_DN1580_c0_g2_i1.p1  ORF type:complete len:189 (-),score=63.26 TRINITY_DN1580_c0_g2_i1:50-616(-)